MKLYKGKVLSYDDWWNILKDNKNVRWKIIAAGGNYGMFERYAPSYSYYKVEDMYIDDDEEGPGYKRLCFSRFVEENGVLKNVGGFPMDNWTNTEYEIRVHNTEPLEIFIDWFDTCDGMRGIYIFRDDDDVLRN